MRSNRGITLVALVITIVVLLILSAVTISLTLGERGVFNLAGEAGSKSNKAEATEKVNLKITQAQMKSYIEKQRVPTLQELADMFNMDNDFEYVHIDKKELAAVVDPFSIGDSSSIFVKLEDYTYEFEIDNSLRLASIDGVRLATAPEGSGEYVSITEYNKLKKQVSDLSTAFELYKTANPASLTKEEINFNFNSGYSISSDSSSFGFKYGKLVNINAPISGSLKSNTWVTIGTLPENLRPRQAIYGNFFNITNGNQSGEFIIYTDGKINVLSYSFSISAFALDVTYFVD